MPEGKVFLDAVVVEVLAEAGASLSVGFPALRSNHWRMVTNFANSQLLSVK
jgi:hypothetical protein